ncbi:MAG: hypothetical protein V4726_06640 [Verrucomicrobiota bacterium]
MNTAHLNLQSQLKQAVGRQALARARRMKAPSAGGDGTCAATGAEAAALPEAASEPVPLYLPDAVTDWLARLSLLYGVPFEYLVPDVRLLPLESIRFFYIDPNWILRAIDGAMSIGTTSSRDNVFNETFYQQVYAAVQAAIPRVRQTVQGSQQPTQLIVGATTTGFLFRSAVVSGYPGLEVIPTYQKMPVPILRLERLSSDIMLALFNGVPDNIEIRQPPEGLHFGITRAPNAAVFNLYLRWLGHTDNPADVPGTQIYPTPGNPLQLIGAPLRSGTGSQPGVVEVATTAGQIVTTLGTAYLGTDETFTSAEFAVEMVLSAGVQPYDVKFKGK